LFFNIKTIFYDAFFFQLFRRATCNIRTNGVSFGLSREFVVFNN